MEIINEFSNYYESIMDLMDPRVEDWFLTSSIAYPVTIITIYLLTYFVIAPRAMKSRTPVLTGPILRYYNPVLIFLNIWLASSVSFYIIKAKYSFLCQRVDYNGGPLENRIASLMWYFHLLKVLEVCDTLFLILKKQGIYDRNSLVHILHHSSMIMATWFLAKFAPGGSSAIIAMINSWVHVGIYAYFKTRHHFNGPTFKIGVDLLQFFQFTIIGVMCVSNFVLRCDYPLFVSVGTLIYVIIFLFIILPSFLSEFQNRHVKDYDSDSDASYSKPKNSDSRDSDLDVD